MATSLNLGIACPCCASMIANNDVSSCQYDCPTGHSEQLGTLLEGMGYLVIGETCEDFNNEEYQCDACGVDTWADYFAGFPHYVHALI